MAANSTKSARGPGRPFEKGKSGNPSGRPKTDERVMNALKAASLDAANTLVDLMNDPQTPAKLRISAATAILDRVYGRPAQHVDIKQEDPVRLVLSGELEKFVH